MNIKTTNRLKPFIKKSRYYNHCDDTPESFLLQTIPSFMSSLYGRKKRQPENKNEWFVQQDPVRSSIEPVITWIGHATFLIQVAGINILTDPIFGDASVFFPRIFAPGIPLAHMPPIDVVILSHNHRDHCDMASLYGLKKENPKMTILVPQGDKKWLEKKGLAPVIEHEWWQSSEQQTDRGQCRFTFLPAHHWSAQGIFDRNKSLWGSWMISFSRRSAKQIEKIYETKDPHMVSDCNSNRIEPWADPSIRLTATQDVCNIYFAGDSAYSGHYHHIADQFPLIHTALMPIAPEEPHPWMRKSHMDAPQAVQAFVDLKAHQFVPMHWGTFPFGLDTFKGPLDRLQSAWNLHELGTSKKLTVLKIGERLII
jgi:L-ascorbate metabolism protein UlaG (beta-lactamase superfamily)